MVLNFGHDCFALFHGACEDGLLLHDNACDSLVCDPPSSVSFMGQVWDSDKGGQAPWTDWLASIMKEVLRVLKPGAYGLVWALPRRSHWTALALEKAGFEIRDIVHHIYAEGFPKNLDVSRKIDEKLGAERKVIGIKNNTYDGAKRDPSKHSNPAADSSFGSWGLTKTPHGLPLTAPATPEAEKWSGWGTALKPAAEHWIMVRKPMAEKDAASNLLAHGAGAINVDASRVPPSGRYPANLVHDGLVLKEHGNFFYAAKPGKSERNAGVRDGNAHVSVKPIVLMNYLVKLVTPAQGTVLDPFMGSGTTGIAAVTQGFEFVGVDSDAHWVDVSRQRILHALEKLKASS